MLLGASALVHGVIVLILWLAEFGVKQYLASKRNAPPSKAAEPPRPCATAAMVSALKCAAWAIPLTLAVSSAAMYLGKRLGFELPPQQITAWLKDGTYALPYRLVIVLYALSAAPILEELIFRRFAASWLNAVFGPAWAIIFSGAIFAAVHQNWLVLAPLCCFGWALGWLYLKTRRVIAPITLHFLFNLVNVVLIFTFPELV